MPLFADLLPPKVRQWAYATLVMLNGGFLVYEAAEGSPLWVKIVLGGLNAGGFVLSAGNVNKSRYRYPEVY